jgi:hypothetical protein
MQRVRSTNIWAVGYDPVRRVLTVQFRSGYVYAYLRVPASLYDELLRAQPHPWTRVGKRVMRYPTRRLGYHRAA